ncbi:MAG: hypothetical protein AB7S38_17615 [Vulcanimicrobiota bacterium]
MRSLKNQYESFGWQLVRAVQAMAESGSGTELEELVITSTLYEAIVRDEPSDPYWSSGDYDTRFDQVAVWTELLATNEAFPESLKLLARSVLSASRRLRTETSKREFEDRSDFLRNVDRVLASPDWLDSLEVVLLRHKAEIENAGLAIEAVESLMISKLSKATMDRFVDSVRKRQEELPEGLSRVERLQELHAQRLANPALVDIKGYSGWNEDELYSMIRELIDEG